MPRAPEAPGPSPIARRNVYELVTESLAAHIEASLEPGDPLPAERSLATTYGVGRSSIREAMRMLESRGLIESRGNGSFVVAPWRNPFDSSLAVFLTGSQSDRDHLFEVRRVLEGEAAALAAARRAEEHLAELTAAVAEMETHLGSMADYTDADLRFHLTIARATGNPLLLHLMQAIRERLHAMFGSVYHYPGGPQRSIEEHRRLVAAIEAGRGDRARKLMNDHINRVERELDELCTAAGRKEATMSNRSARA